MCYTILYSITIAEPWIQPVIVKRSVAVFSGLHSTQLLFP